MPDLIKDTLYLITANPEPEPRPIDTEIPKAMNLQQRWLNLPSVKARRKALGWDAHIHPASRVTYRDVRDFPRYNWHKWMSEQIKQETT